MPNWKIHIEVGKRLLDNLKYNEEEKQYFLLGSILADINNCFIVPNISKKIVHPITHYHSKDVLSHINFYNVYKNEIKTNPLVYGYFIHLYTDNIWNIDFYTKYSKRGSNVFTDEDLNEIKYLELSDFEKIIKETNNKEEIKKMKHNDFKKYNGSFKTNVLDLSNYKEAVQKTKIINNVLVNEDDLIKVDNFLKNEINPTNIDYKFYEKAELDDLLEKTVEEIANFSL